MSANNWAVCPRCMKRALSAVESERAKVADAYGLVPAEEYERMRAALPNTPVAEGFRTFREDWEIGVRTADGQFWINYGGGCDECGLSHSFQHGPVPIT